MTSSFHFFPPSHKAPVPSNYSKRKFLLNHLWLSLKSHMTMGEIFAQLPSLLWDHPFSHDFLFWDDLQILRGLTANLQQSIFLTVLYLESVQILLKWNLEQDKDYTTHFPVCFHLYLFYLPWKSLWWIFRDDIVKSLGVPVILYNNLQGH